jgi:hypothetical protein
MKKYIGVIAVFFILLSSTCSELSPDDLSDNEIDPGDFVVVIQGIRLSTSELGTVSGKDVSLRAILNPPFATEKTLKCTATPVNSAAPKGAWFNDVLVGSEPDSVITDSLTPAIKITDTTVTNPIVTIIRVESKDDPAIYAECPLTVYPVYAAARSWKFATHPSGGGTNSAISADLGSVERYNDNGFWFMIGNGGATGYATDSAGFYKIDPNDPYKTGVQPSGSSRSGYNWGDATNPSGGLPDGFSAGHIRTGGHSRAMKIAALQGPFTIIVNYMTNGTSGANTDIRIGDTDGFLIMGEGSESSNSAGARTVYYVNPKDDIVPLVFIETNISNRIYDVIVLSTAENPKYPVRTAVIDGETYTY